MENKRVVNAVRLSIAIVILTVVVFVVDLIVNRDKKITDLINVDDKNKVVDNYNGVYSYKDQLGKNVYAFSGCSFTYISNYILVVDDNYYLYRSSCMGTYLKDKGKTKELNIGDSDDGYYITKDGIKYNKDSTVSNIIPNNKISTTKDKMDLNSLSTIAKETEFEGNYYDFTRPIRGLDTDMNVIFKRNEHGSFFMQFTTKWGAVIYTYQLKSFDSIPQYYTIGAKLVMIEPEINEEDSSKYSYKFKSLAKDGVEYDLRSFFPYEINGEVLTYENNSVYVMYDPSSRNYRMFVGYDKKFCVENSTSNDPAYYEFKITYDYKDNKFTRPEYVGLGRKKEGCGYIKETTKGGL